jgi:hypothetical protein
MAEPGNGNLKAADEVYELHIVWNKTTGQVQLSGCVHVAPLALGLLDYTRELVTARLHGLAPEDAPRVVPVAVMPPRRM